MVELCGALRDMIWEPGGEKSREKLWMGLARIAARHSKAVASVDVSSLLYDATRGAVMDVGELWIVLGDYLIRKGLFEDEQKVKKKRRGRM